MKEEQRQRCVKLFGAAVVLEAISEGLSGSIFSNYFRDAFSVTALQRGFLETPRESGGILCAVIFMGLSFLGNSSLGILAQVLMIIGLSVMAFLQPSYGVMVLFLFIYSIGQHLFMPVNDSIGLSLAKDGQSGGSLGYFKKRSSFASMAAGAAVFVGFKTGFFNFTAPVITNYVIAIVACVGTAVLLLALHKALPPPAVKNSRTAIRKDYIPYYIVTFGFGCQKRIRIVFGPWILIELLSRGADTIALLALVARFVGGYVAPWVGKMLDKKGVRFSLRFEAAYMAVLFVLQGMLAGGIVSGKLQGTLWLLIAYVGYVLTALTDQFQMVHSVLLKKLAGEREQDVTANLSMGISVDHVMAIVISPILGFVWTGIGPAWVFYITAVSVLVQLAVSLTVRLPKTGKEVCA